MKQDDRRVSEINLADSIDAAISLEKNRVQLLDDAMIGQVSAGGSGGSSAATGPTMGFVPTENQPK